MIRFLKKLIFVAILLAGLAVIFFDSRFERSADPNWGLNFSLTKAQYLGFDWKKMYLAILNELKPERLRVMVLWEVVEPARDQYNFQDIDFLVSQAEKHGARIILTLGYKQPGWPECHSPGWAQNLEQSAKDEELLEFVRQVVERYKQSPVVFGWQVENEPFFEFGPECPAIGKELFRREIALVKMLDPGRAVILTDSGEKGLWLPTARAGADIFGATMYRTAYHDKFSRYITYPLPPLWYRAKAGLLKTLLGIDRVIGVELQAEPWFISDVYQTPWLEQKRLMNAEIFKKNADYARKAGLAENYFWGVEWWYHGKEKQNDPEMWDAAKVIFNTQ